MKKIFSKDECVPDAQTLRQFSIENNIFYSTNFPVFRISYEDWEEVYFSGEDGKFYREDYSCGVFEDLLLFDDMEEYMNKLRETLSYCKVF